MLITFCCLAYVKVATADKPIYEYTREKDGCCKVVKLDDLYTWKLHKNDGDFVAHFCPDYDLSAYDPMPGLMLKKFKYRDMGLCWSVREKELGFWWELDVNDKVVVAN